MKSVVIRSGKLHIETPLGVVNITVGLTDFRGRRVDSIAVSPCSDTGEKPVVLRGLHNTRLVELKGHRRKHHEHCG